LEQQKNAELRALQYQLNLKKFSRKQSSVRRSSNLIADRLSYVANSIMSSSDGDTMGKILEEEAESPTPNTSKLIASAPRNSNQNPHDGRRRKFGKNTRELY
jgi:hypothetical protein